MKKNKGTLKTKKKNGDRNGLAPLSGVNRGPGRQRENGEKDKRWNHRGRQLSGEGRNTSCQKGGNGNG